MASGIHVLFFFFFLFLLTRLYQISMSLRGTEVPKQSQEQANGSPKRLLRFAHNDRRSEVLRGVYFECSRRAQNDLHRRYFYEKKV